jgi:Ca2+-binding RTX toxin-like protein
MAITAINLSSLDGTNGVRLDGVAVGEYSGISVSNAGDVNGDEFDDVIISGHRANPNGNSSGSSYVVFGKASGFDASLNLSSLNGSNGFRLDGAVYDYSGRPVSNAGDVNGDGFGDVIVGAYGTNSSYVVFGKASGFDASLNLPSLNGSNGFRLEGAEDEYSNRSVSNAGDVNGDGFDDLIVSAVKSNVGSSYVVFGKASGFDATLDLSSLNGSNGFRLNGAVAYDVHSIVVSSAGDVNGDGFDDVIVGALGAEPNGNYYGSSYVVFGKGTGFDASMDLSSLNGSSGFRFDVDKSVSSVSSAGDVNGDNFDDIIIGVNNASYVVFGKSSGFNPIMNLSELDGSNGFHIDDGLPTLDLFGLSVSGAGDVNRDGFDDVIAGAVLADPNGVSAAGSSYVVFGKASGFDATLNLSNLDSNSGLRLDGTATFDESGSSVSGAGDVNNDGFDDVIVGAIWADPNGVSKAGSSYIVFGHGDSVGSNVIQGTPKNDVLKGTPAADIFKAGNGNDIMNGYGGADVFHAGNGNDTLNGGGGNDTLIGEAGADTMNGAWGNDSYFVDNIGDKVIEKVNQGIDSVSSKITHTLSANVENLTLTGAAKINGTGNNLANAITGNSAANQLSGGAGNDTLDGGWGADRLTGGTGHDIFKFTVKSAADLITDYNVANDTIQLENTVFAALKITGTLAAGQFKVGTKAADANDFIIYNKTAGMLLYDADGNGAIAATQIATIGGGLSLTHADIVVI